MRKGFCRAKPSSWPARIAATRAGVPSKPTSFTLPASPASWRASSIPPVEVSFTTKMPCRSRPWRFSRFSEARFAVSTVGPAYWSATTSSRPGQPAFSRARNPSSRAVVLADPSW